MRRPVSKFVIPCTALVVLLSALANAATDLPPGYEVATQVVKFSDLNLNDPKAVVTLYRRIATAADAVCEPVDLQMIESRTRLRRCERKAIADAVRDVHSPSLTSFYMTTTDHMEFTMAR
jgi:UrcA family protein